MCVSSNYVCIHTHIYEGWVAPIVIYICAQGKKVGNHCFKTPLCGFKRNVKSLKNVAIMERM